MTALDPRSLLFAQLDPARAQALTRDALARCAERGAQSAVVRQIALEEEADRRLRKPADAQSDRVERDSRVAARRERGTQTG